MHDVSLGNEDRMCMEDEPNRETQISNAESICDSAPMGSDLSSLEFEKSMPYLYRLVELSHTPAVIVRLNKTISGGILVSVRTSSLRNPFKPLKIIT